MAKQQWVDVVIVAQDFCEHRLAPEIETKQRFMERWQTRRR